MAATLVADMLEAKIQSASWRTRDNTRLTLSDSVCTGATLRLQAILAARGFGLDIERHMTRGRIEAIEANHVYLLVKDFYPAGGDLIIDPTIRQFFREALDAQQISSVPQIFIGSERELEALFLERFMPTMAAPTQDARMVSNRYLESVRLSGEW